MILYVKKIYLPVFLVASCLILSSCQIIKGKYDGLSLFNAIGSLNLESVKEAVEKGSNINRISNIIGNENSVKYAMEKNSKPIVKYLLEEGANPNYIDENGISLMMYTVGGSIENIKHDNIINIEFTKLLINHGADVNLIGQKGYKYSILDSAVGQNGNDAIITLLLNSGAKISKTTAEASLKGYHEDRCEDVVVHKIFTSLLKDGLSTGVDSALEAAIVGNSSEVIRLVNSNKIIKSDELNILKFITAYGNMEAFELILSKGFDVNTEDAFGYTLLNIAVRHGNLEIVKYLVDRGVDVNEIYNDGETPLTKAIENSHINVAKFLIEKGAKMHTRYSANEKEQNAGPDILEIASGNGDVDMVKWIIANKYPLNEELAYFAMLSAVKNNQLKVLQYLIDNGANPNTENVNGSLLMNLCMIDEYNIDLVKFLIECGADVNGGKDKGSPLMLCSISNRPDIAEYLLFMGADPNAIATYEDGSRSVPIIVTAIEYGAFDIIKLLVEHGAKLEYTNYGYNQAKETAVQTALRNPSKHIIDYLKLKSKK
jgi:ankyrin repeat protein